MKVILPGSRSGVALILVLVLVALLSLISTALCMALRTRLIEDARREIRFELKESARAGLAAKLAELAENQSVNGGVFTQKRGVPPAAAAYAQGQGVELHLTVVDESALLPINTSDTVLLASLFQHLDIPADTSEKLAAALADWEDPDDELRPNGAEKEAYPEGLGPKNAPLDEMVEVLEVRGFREWFCDQSGVPNERFLRLESLASVYATNPRPNINGASREVMSLLLKDSGGGADRLLDFISQQSDLGGVKNASELAGSAAASDLASRVTFTATTLRLQITASRGDAFFSVEALVSIQSQKVEVRWVRERYDSKSCDANASKL